ncbi:MAG: hypothetical protein IPO83_10680 [Chitinophagaceae bacterium]|nr:hypothetical protein [Chitinophagaceae bacterium]
MWNFLTGNKNKQPAVVQPLTVDLHSHLIPGIDDGAQTEAECLLLLRGMADLGYSKCITTPHCYPGFYNNTPASIASGLARLKAICVEQTISLQVEAAAEYFFDNTFFEIVEKNELLCFGKQYVLFELPSNSRPAMIEEIVFKMNLNGYQPVLAHPERYPYFHDKKMYEYQKLKDHGVLFQLNLMSLTGYYNPGIRAVARDLIRHEMVDFAGTDIHKEKHLPVLHSVQQDHYYLQLLSSGKLLNNTL